LKNLVVQEGGGLDLSSFPARCTTNGGCGWEGVPTYIDGVAQTECPSCEVEPDDDLLRQDLPEQRRVEKVGRNDPCLCGSGKKSKKCCGA
jgi:hypothetical protein